MKLQLEDLRTGKKWIAKEIKQEDDLVTFCDGKEHYHHRINSDYASHTGCGNCDCKEDF